MTALSALILRLRLKEGQIFEHEDNPAHNEQLLALAGAAHVYALLNDEAHAMTALEKAYNGHYWFVALLRTAPEFDSIRSSPHFRDLVRRIGFPPSPSDKN